MSEHFDYIIIGSGPAGLQLGYYLQKSNRSYVILEAGCSPGTSFKRFPRHRKLISINKIHTGYNDTETNLRWDWNSLLSDGSDFLFKQYSNEYFPQADDLVTYLGKYAERYNLQIRYNTRVVTVSKHGEFKVLDAQGTSYSCKRLIVATGLSKPYIPGIPGVELAENYCDASINSQDFVKQKVLIIGKGNSGFETADNIIPTASIIHIISPEPVTFAWKSHYVGNLRAINNNFLDTYQLKSQNAILDAAIENIKMRDGKYIVSVVYTHAQGEAEDIMYDRVICCTGFRFDHSMFDGSCSPKLALNDRYPAQTSSWESVNIPDLYFAGVLMQMRDPKKATSGFIHGFRYNVQILQKIFESRYHGRQFEYTTVSATANSLTDAVIARVNKTSALWQQFGFLCDLFVICDNHAKHYEEFPCDYIHDGAFANTENYFLLTLEFGKVTGDPFVIDRYPTPDMANESVFLHPIIRHYRRSELQGEIHLLEDLDAVWRKKAEHVEPLQSFFQNQLRSIGVPYEFGGSYENV